MTDSQEERKSTHANPMMTTARIIKNCKVAIVTMLHWINLSISELNENRVLNRKIKTSNIQKNQMKILL